MSVNSSSNVPPPDCHIGTYLFIFVAIFVIYILLLPLFILILYMGYQRCRKQDSFAVAAMNSHSDIFTFHMVAMELISVLGSSVFGYGTHTNQRFVMYVGMDIYSIIGSGQTLFHLFTCVEHYLAVVHPVTYLGLRRAGGVRIRNTSIGCAWLICFAVAGLFNNMVGIITYLLFLMFSMIIISFCSLSVLCVLIRPGPGEVGGNRERVDQSKHRAFHTITSIMGALLTRLLGYVVSSVIYLSSGQNMCDHILIMASLMWSAVPSSLVLPLLFLHRAGKLPGCTHNTESG